MNISEAHFLDTLFWRGAVSVFPSVEMTVRKSHGRNLIDVKSLSDEAIAFRVQAGHHDLLGELVRRHSDRLFSIILRMVASWSAAEDILQDTWVKVVRKFHLYDPSKPPAPWLTKVALNCCRDYFRREKLRRFWRRPAESEDYLDPLERAGTDTFTSINNRADISGLLKKLSAKLREVVVLKFYSGLTHAEIAEIIGIPIGTVKSRLHLALTELRKHINSQEK